MRKEVEDNMETKRTKEVSENLKSRYDIQSREMEALR